MLSYVVKTASGKKNVLMLTSLKPLLGTTIDDQKVKPAPYKLYDFTEGGTVEGGTDVVGQRMGFYSCKPKCRRWPIVAFSYILDMARVNSSTLYYLNRGESPLQKNSFEFGMELARKLVSPMSRTAQWLI